MRTTTSNTAQEFLPENLNSAIQSWPRGPKRLGPSVIVFVLLLIGVLAEAQQQSNIPRIGFLIASSRSVNAGRQAVFRQGLRELGYIEGNNIFIEWRFGDGKIDRLPTLAAELVRLKVDVIVTAGPADTKAAKQATSTIPIIMTYDNDPVANGFVASLAHPGGNITGLSTLAPELGGKRLELLREIIAKLSRVALLYDSKNPGNTLELKEVQRAADGFKIKLQIIDVLDSKDIEPAFGAAKKGSAGAMLVLGSPLFNVHRKQLVELAITSRLPAMYYQRDSVEAGGLVSYGVNRNELLHRSATFVDKILKGTKPADIPVEQPMKFEFIVNLKAAKQINLTIPPNVLVRADRVIR